MNQTKVILHLSHTHIATDSRILKSMDAAVKSGFKVVGIGASGSEATVRSSMGKYLTIFEYTIWSQALISKMPKAIRRPFLPICFAELTIKILARGVRIRPSIVHCNDTLALSAALFIKLFTGCKIIYDAHELESDRNGISLIEGKIYFYFERLFWRFIDALIVVSPSINDWYQKNMGCKLSAIILNSPLIVDDTSYSRNYLREYFDIPARHKVFVYVGFLAEGRGLEHLVQTFESDEVESHFVLLGYGPLFDKIMKKTKFSEKIHVHPAVSHEEVANVTRSADVGVCFVENVSLSDYFCLPNKLFEYAFSDLAVISSNFPDITKMVSDFGLGVVTSPDLDGVYSSVLELEKMDLQDFYKNKDLTPISWEAQSVKLLSLYNTVLQKRG